MIIVGTPHSKGSGYFINDKNLASRQEADIRTCPHCQALIKMQEWAKAPVQNFCLKCMAPACNRKECEDCIPFMRKIEQFIKMQLQRKRLLGG